MKREITVVVPARNEEKNIERCLKSLKNQEVKPEIIVVDGHSTDRTRKIARKYAKVILDNKKGVGDARNLGWKHARTDIVAYADADSRAPRDWTRKIIENMNGCVAVGGPIVPINGSWGTRANLKLWTDYMFRFLNRINQTCLCGSNMAFPRKVLRKHPFRANLMEDTEIANRLRKVGKIKYMKGLRMFISPRRYEESFYRMSLKYYIPNFIRMKLFNEIPKDYDYFD